MTAISRSILVPAIATLAIGATWLCAKTAEADRFAGCDKGEFCIFEHRDGSGRHASFDKGTDNLAAPEVFKGVLNDKASAVWNRDVDPWCIYEHADTRSDRGHTAMVPKGFKGSIAGLRTRDGFRWNDKISAVRKAHYVSPPRNPAASHFEC